MNKWVKIGLFILSVANTADTPASAGQASSTPPSFLKGKRICIDPGHGGTSATDHYRVGKNGEREEWVNLRVSLLLKAILESRGATVTLTRTDDSSVEIARRAEIARNSKADAFISVHHNAIADRDVNFPIVYFHGAASENIAGKKLAIEVAKAFKKNLYKSKTTPSIASDFTIFPNRGAGILRDSYGIPAVIAEASFLTNEREESLLKRTDHNNNEARAYLGALEIFFSNPIPKIKPVNIPKVLPPFEVLQEADRMKPEALKWKNNYGEAKRLLKVSPLPLQKAYDLFTQSARSFPDSFLAGECHRHRADLLSLMQQTKLAEQESRRATEYYVDLTKN